MSYASASAVVVSLHIDSKYAVEVFFSRGLDVADVRHSGVVHQDIDFFLTGNLLKSRSDGSLLRNVGAMCKSSSAKFGYFRDYSPRIWLIGIKNLDCGAVLGKLERNRPPDPATAAGDDCDFSIQAEFAAVVRVQSDTPRFQGIKSCWFFCSALV